MTAEAEEAAEGTAEAEEAAEGTAEAAEGTAEAGEGTAKGTAEATSFADAVDKMEEMPGRRCGGGAETGSQHQSSETV